LEVFDDSFITAFEKMDQNLKLSVTTSANPGFGHTQRYNAHWVLSCTIHAPLDFANKKSRSFSTSGLVEN
jgi:hypothetical protein